MNTQFYTTLVISLALSIAPAWGQTDETRSGSGIERAAEKTGAALDKAARKTGQALDKAATATGDAVETAVDKTGQALEKAGRKLQQWAGEEDSTQ